MLYNPPSGSTDPNASYVGKNVPAGLQGSRVPRAAVENTQREIVNAILQAGMAPTNDDLFQLTRVIRGGQLDWDATDSGTADAVVCQIGLPHSQIIAGMPFCFVKGAAANTGNAVPTLTITDLAGNNAVSGTIVKATGAPLAKGDLPAGALIFVRAIAANKFALISLTTPSDVATIARPRLTAATTYYVDPVNGSDSNTGLSPATPWKTRQKAWNTIVNTVDLAGNNVIVRLLPGTYTDSFLASCPVIGNSNGVGAVLFQGTVGNNAAVLIATTNGNGWLNQGGAQFLLDSMSIQTAGTNTIGIAAGSGGIIAYSNIAFGQCALAHISASAGGRTQQIGPVTINSGSGSHVAAADGGGAIIAGQSLTLVGTPAFTQFASVEGSAQVTANSLTITGGATGKQYTIIGSGTLKTTGQTLPGNAAGTSPTTSQVI